MILVVEEHLVEELGGAQNLFLRQHTRTGDVVAKETLFVVISASHHWASRHCRVSQRDYTSLLQRPGLLLFLGFERPLPQCSFILDLVVGAPCVARRRALIFVCARPSQDASTCAKLL